jgi:hypothetical protein
MHHIQWIFHLITRKGTAKLASVQHVTYASTSKCVCTFVRVYVHNDSVTDVKYVFNLLPHLTDIFFDLINTKDVQWAIFLRSGNPNNKPQLMQR